jgi:hypothetical protein
MEYGVLYITCDGKMQTILFGSHLCSVVETQESSSSAKKILLRGIQLTKVQRYWGSIVKMVFSYKMFTFYEANTYVALPNAWRCSVRTLF